jgi:hypothetical protein
MGTGQCERQSGEPGRHHFAHEQGENLLDATKRGFNLNAVGSFSNQ